MHRTVLLHEACSLVISPDLMSRSAEPAWLVDATFGAGGHTAELLRLTPEHVRVIALDQDAAAIDQGRETLRDFISAGRLELVHGRFGDLASLSTGRKFAGILADLGFSSTQMDAPDRGLSFMVDGPLDMRLDRSRGSPLYERLSELTESDLANILFRDGEERFSRSIARRIMDRNAGPNPIRTTDDLVAAIKAGVPPSARHGRIHCATRTFQALRIWINDELGELDRLLATAPSLLTQGGRLAVISFHSLEDRRVKIAFKSTPWKILTRKPVVPTEAELTDNRRARSAKLRCAELRA